MLHRPDTLCAPYTAEGAGFFEGKKPGITAENHLARFEQRVNVVAVVKVIYMGVDRERLLALREFRRELLDISRHYRPGHAEARAIGAVILSLDDLMGELLGDREIFWGRPV